MQCIHSYTQTLCSVRYIRTKAKPKTKRIEIYIKKTLLFLLSIALWLAFFIYFVDDLLRVDNFSSVFRRQTVALDQTFGNSGSNSEFLWKKFYFCGLFVTEWGKAFCWLLWIVIFFCFSCRWKATSKSRPSRSLATLRRFSSCYIFCLHLYRNISL